MDAATTPVLSDYELERGKPMPSKLHALLTQRITVYLTNHYPEKFEAYPELTLDTPGEKTTPDIAICEKEIIDFSHDAVRESNPPLATIEILSPTQFVQTLVDKTQEYFSFGVKSCWIVLPTLKSIYVFSAPGQHEVFGPGDEVYDPNLDIRVPMDVIFASKS